jgi:hypothetical protein
MNAACPAGSAERYEALRQNAVTREQIFSVAPFGAILVVKNGVAGWMRQWRQAAGQITAVPSGPRTAPPNEPGWQHDLTVLLAQMSAPHLRPGPSA